MLHANQPDTGTHGLSAQAQHVTRNPGAHPEGDSKSENRGTTGASVVEEGETLKLGDKTVHPHPDKRGGGGGLVQTCRLVGLYNYKTKDSSLTKKVRSHWLFSALEEFCTQSSCHKMLTLVSLCFKAATGSSTGDLLSNSQAVWTMDAVGELY